MPAPAPTVSLGVLLVLAFVHDIFATSGSSHTATSATLVLGGTPDAIIEEDNPYNPYTFEYENRTFWPFVQGGGGSESAIGSDEFHLEFCSRLCANFYNDDELNKDGDHGCHSGHSGVKYCGRNAYVSCNQACMMRRRGMTNAQCQEVCTWRECNVRQKSNGDPLYCGHPCVSDSDCSPDFPTCYKEKCIDSTADAFVALDKAVPASWFDTHCPDAAEYTYVLCPPLHKCSECEVEGNLGCIYACDPEVWQIPDGNFSLDASSQYGGDCADYYGKNDFFGDPKLLEPFPGFNNCSVLGIDTVGCNSDSRFKYGCTLTCNKCHLINDQGENDGIVEHASADFAIGNDNDECFGWKPSQAQQGEWVEFTLDGLWVIRKIKVGGSNGEWPNGVVSAYDVRYTRAEGGINIEPNWECADDCEDLHGPSHESFYSNRCNEENVAIATLDKPIVAHKVRIYPVKWISYPSMRADLLGFPCPNLNECQCQEGQHVEFTNQAVVCKSCPGGHFQASSNHLHTECESHDQDLRCQQGAFIDLGDEYRDHVCKECEPETYQPNNDSDATTCIDWRVCPMGFIINNTLPASTTRNRECQPCPNGTYSDRNNAVYCAPHEPCITGMYETKAPTPISDRECAPCVENGHNCTPLTILVTHNGKSVSVSGFGTSAIDVNTGDNVVIELLIQGGIVPYEISNPTGYQQVGLALDQDASTDARFVISGPVTCRNPDRDGVCSEEHTITLIAMDSAPNVRYLYLQLRITTGFGEMVLLGNDNGNVVFLHDSVSYAGLLSAGGGSNAFQLVGGTMPNGLTLFNDGRLEGFIDGNTRVPFQGETECMDKGARCSVSHDCCSLACIGHADAGQAYCAESRDFIFTVRAKDLVGGTNTTKDWIFKILPKLSVRVVSQGGSNVVTAQQPVQRVVEVFGGKSPYSISVSGTPPGMMFESVSLLSGSPDVSSDTDLAASVLVTDMTNVQQTANTMFQIRLPDCNVSTFGPDGIFCQNNGTCVDDVPHNGFFTCQCTVGWGGQSCDQLAITEVRVVRYSDKEQISSNILDGMYYMMEALVYCASGMVTDNIEYFIADGTLPNGLTINVSTGLIEGTVNESVTEATTMEFVLQIRTADDGTSIYLQKIGVQVWPQIVFNKATRLVQLNLGEETARFLFDLSGGTGPSIRVHRIPSALRICGTNPGQLIGTPTQRTDGIDVIRIEVVDDVVKYAVNHSIAYQVDSNDCDDPTNGPGGIGCGAGATCIDTTRFDGIFECNCSGTGLVASELNSNCHRLSDVAAGAMGGGDGGETFGVGVIASVAVGTLALLVIGVLLTRMRRQRLMRLEPFDFVAELERLRREGLLAAAPDTEEDGAGDARRVPKELKRSRFVLLNELGKGAFGLVQKALYRPPDNTIPEFLVAVKTLHEGYTREERDELIKEATVTAQFDHDNVVGLIGVVTSGDPMMLALQFCEKGSLKSLLANDNKGAGLINCRLFSYSVGITRGMQYLASKNFVHRDIAARNVLVDAADKAKIADFGLSRDIEDNAYYRTSHATKMPIRWAAVEVLESRKFSEKSDVWAYGVTLIEMFTKAETPYPGWMNSAVMERVLGGYVLPQPAHLKGKLAPVYTNIIKPCFLPVAADRPTFADLVAAWDKYLADLGDDFEVLGKPDPAATALQQKASLATDDTTDSYTSLQNYSAVSMTASIAESYEYADAAEHELNRISASQRLGKKPTKGWGKAKVSGSSMRPDNVYDMADPGKPANKYPKRDKATMYKKKPPPGAHAPGNDNEYVYQPSEDNPYVHPMPVRRERSQVVNDYEYAAPSTSNNEFALPLPPRTMESPLYDSSDDEVAPGGTADGGDGGGGGDDNEYGYYLNPSPSVKGHLGASDAP